MSTIPDLIVDMNKTLALLAKAAECVIYARENARVALANSQQAEAEFNKLRDEVESLLDRATEI